MFHLSPQKEDSRNSLSLFFSMASARLRAIRWRCSSVSDGELFTGMEEEVWFGRPGLGTEEEGGGEEEEEDSRNSLSLFFSMASARLLYGDSLATYEYIPGYCIMPH